MGAAFDSAAPTRSRGFLKSLDSGSRQFERLTFIRFDNQSKPSSSLPKQIAKQCDSRICSRFELGNIRLTSPHQSCKLTLRHAKLRPQVSEHRRALLNLITKPCDFSQFALIKLRLPPDQISIASHYQVPIPGLLDSGFPISGLRPDLIVQDEHARHPQL